MDPYDLRHAYAVLELSPPVSVARLKGQYKTLAKRWHPDRYQADPAGQAEATERLRNINIAYELVAASLEPAPLDSNEPSQVVPYVDPPDRPFSLSRERIDAIVDSINRAQRVSLLPEMSLHRWLSVGALIVYVFAAMFILPANHGRSKPEIAKAVGLASRFIWLPMYMIWTGDNDTRSNLENWFYRWIGWLLMAAPAVVILVLWITH
jgi:hypothetical protein